MPRLIILMLPVAALIVLAVQNRVPVIALNFLGGSLPAIPFGLLIAIAAGVGALVTLLLYGLIGLRRPPESKYKPMGRRVPYPDTSGSSSLPTNPTTAPPYSPAEPTTTYSTSAFVNDPAPDGPPASIPQDAPKDTYRDAPRETYEEPFDGPDLSAQDLRNELQRSSNHTSDNSFVGSIRSNLSSAKKKYLDRGRPVDEKPVGDDWGELRTTEQINDWEAATPSVVEEGLDSLFKFGKSAGTNVGRIADDIASGWNNQNRGNRPPVSQSESDYPRSGAYSAEPYSDELDHGWENFDDGYDSPPLASSAASSSKRTYGDSLYEEESLPTVNEHADEIGPDGVYEADYKVIVPPSKPLDEPSLEDVEDDRYYS